MRTGLIFFYMLCIAGIARSQEETSGRLSPRELAIPPSPVFDLMGVTPAQINRASAIRDFKVDWTFKSWKLSPNLAIQAQPVWELLFNRRDLASYQNAPGLLRRLSTLDVSIGTVQNEDNDRRIGFSCRMNLYRQKDPLLAKDLYADLSVKYTGQRQELEQQMALLQHQLDSASDLVYRAQIREQLLAASGQLLELNSLRQQEVSRRAQLFVSEHWNASSVDLAVGRVYTYQTDSSGSLAHLRLNRNTAKGAWLNAALGLGKKFLLSALVRNIWYQEELNFQLQDQTTLNLIPARAVADNTLFSLGINIRYGSAIHNFFVEMLYEQKGIKSALAALHEVFPSPGPGETIVGSSVAWNVVHPNTLSIGGDWRLGRSVGLNYGMRCVFDKHWNFKTFTPVAAIYCMMR